MGALASKRGRTVAGWAPTTRVGYAADQQFGFGRCVQFPAPVSDSQRQLLEVLVDHEVVQAPALDLGQDVFIFGARQRPVEEALTNVELREVPRLGLEFGRNA